jgi:hypothetical protein
MATALSFHTDSVEVLQAVVVTDRYGNDTLDWSSPTVTVVPRCRVQPIPSAELLDRLSRRWVLYAPPDTALVSANRVRWRGVTYDVAGEVRRWSSPSGALAHIEADLTRVEG